MLYRIVSHCNVLYRIVLYCIVSIFPFCYSTDFSYRKSNFKEKSFGWLLSSSLLISINNLMLIVEFFQICHSYVKIVLIFLLIWLSQADPHAVYSQIAAQMGAALLDFVWAVRYHADQYVWLTLLLHTQADWKVWSFYWFLIKVSCVFCWFCVVEGRWGEASSSPSAPCFWACPVRFWWRTSASSCWKQEPGWQVTNKNNRRNYDQ